MSSVGEGSLVLDKPTQLDGGDERRSDSLSRSRTRLRRFVVHNELRVLLSPTYSDVHLQRAGDRAAVNLDLRNLVRRLKVGLGRPIPYAFMPEVQPQRSERMGFEVFNGMVLVPVLPKAVLLSVRDSWPYGMGDGYNGFDWQRWESARGASGYASKALHEYASKGLGSAPKGEQAYRVAQGFKPPMLEVDLPRPHNSAVEAAQEWASEAISGDVVAFCDLREVETVRDACWLAWD